MCDVSEMTEEAFVAEWAKRNAEQEEFHYAQMSDEARERYDAYMAEGDEVDEWDTCPNRPLLDSDTRWDEGHEDDLFVTIPMFLGEATIWDQDREAGA